MMGARCRLGALLATVALLAACAGSPRTRVVLLPQDNGRPSAVVIHGKGGDTLLSQPYQRATARQDTATPPKRDEISAQELQEALPLLFKLAPPKPERFTLYFVAGGTVLTVESLQVLDQALADAKSRSGGDIVITGHTDTRGTAQLNDQLSAQRASEVRQLFINKGFPSARIESAGRGDRELAVPTAVNVDEPRNRRVLIEVR